MMTSYFYFLKFKISGEHAVEKLCPHGLLRAERPHHRPGVSLTKNLLHLSPEVS